MSTELIYEKKTVYQKADSSVIDKAFEYAEGYKKYLDLGKTEREANIIEISFGGKKLTLNFKEGTREE